MKTKIYLEEFLHALAPRVPVAQEECNHPDVQWQRVKYEAEDSPQ